MQKLSFVRESWPISGAFTISRGSKTASEVVVVTLERDGKKGQGECVPYRHYGESIGLVMSELAERRGDIEEGFTHEDIPRLLKLKAAQNALDCALWDLEAKLAGKRVWQLLDLPPPEPLVTAFTLSLDSVDNMAAAAARENWRPLLKLKLGADKDAERLRAVRKAAPASRIIVDANEGWSADDLPMLLGICAEAGVELVEQPLPAKHDGALSKLARPVAVCADESAHDEGSLAGLVGKYDAINVKLDKTGGLTHALAMRRTAERLGFGIMVGCMVATSLSMAPAHIAAQGARIVDLDGPLLLAKDRTPSMRYDNGLVYGPDPALWG
jgi:L-alanine-DL-glutamate epimerase-like enolase superfamily enzyme